MRVAGLDPTKINEDTYFLKKESLSNMLKTLKILPGITGMIKNGTEII